MKKLLLILITTVLGTSLFAQKIVPAITGNSVLNYTTSQNGQDIPLVLTITNFGDPIKMDWNMDGIGSGSYEMSAKSLQSGKSTPASTPAADELTRLASYQTFACISKDAFNSMIKNNTFEYDDLKFSVKADAAPFTVDNKQLDVIHAIATNGKGELWILNNAGFPLICKSKDSAHGMDLTLVSIQ